MRYSVFGGAVQLSIPTSRRPIASRPWLRQAAAYGATLPSHWARQAVSKRSILAVMIGAAVIGASAANRDIRGRPIQVSAPVAIGVSAGPQPAILAGGAMSPPAQAAQEQAQRALSSLSAPGYLLTNATAKALQDVRGTVADAAMLQQLRSQILAPAPPSGLSSAMLNDLASLVRQAQVVSAAAASTASMATMPSTGESRVGESKLDPVQLAQAETAVRVAQQDVLQATKARDEAALGTGPAPVTAAITPAATTAAVVSIATPPAVAAIAPTAPAVTAADPALIRNAQSRLADAQAHLQALLAVPAPDAVAAARKAVDDALAAAPAAPSADSIAVAKAAVDRAQKEYDTALQGPNSSVVAAALAGAEGRPTPTLAAGRSASGAQPVADPGEKPQDTLNRVVHGPDPQRVADTKANLDSARAALAALQQQAAIAADPESQPAVIEARRKLAALIAPPDAAAIADAQAVVSATQRQLDTLLGKPAVPAPTATSSAAQATTTPVATTAAASVAATPAAAVATASTPPATANASSTPAPPSTATAADAVAAAEQRLADAQKRLRELIVTSPDPSLNSAQTAAVPAGSTATQITPEIQAAQSALASSVGVSRNDLTAIGIELRARYVADAVLTSAHLHPSAFASPLPASLERAGAAASHSFAWPVVGPITQPFGVPELGVGAPHTGADIAVPIGTPVLASASGVVSFAGGDPSSGYGYYAIIDNGGGVSTLYAHLALPPFLHPGQFLAQAGLVGLSGSTGFSTGPHVHFEVRLNGVPVDPLKVLAPSPGR